MRSLLPAAIAACLAVPAAAGTLFGPSPYLAFAHSPFAGLGLSNFVLQTFDAGGLEPATVTASGGAWLNFGSLIDSVEGGGSVPGSWYSNGLVAVSFDFAPYAARFGNLPSHAAIVWTDVGFRLSDGGIGGPSEVRFLAVDGLGAIHQIIASLGDGSVAGETAEDRVFGFASRHGVRAITLVMPDSIDWEMDHLHYGTIPEAGTWAMLIAGFGLVGVALRRRRLATA